MSNKQTYTQCRLERKLPNDFCVEDVVWIPSEFAHVGKYLRIKGVNGWKVVSRGETLDSETLGLKHRDHLHQHEASDIDTVPTRLTILRNK